MKIFVTVKTGTKEKKVEKISDNTFKVSVREKPIDGRANAEIVEVLAAHFGISKSSVRIVSGATSKKKLIEIDIT
ncbi:MAG: DUF167 domain-containing protein [bacterium]|nr:DUF167 domain-containing protein [bacterium]